ncbi:MAG: glycoside hydrolase family 25 protein [Lachnospiraceae bacterium]|nr:glycoside hydrolase family 25 protein [Lachnospiraceae bacterium]
MKKVLFLLAAVMLTVFFYGCGTSAADQTDSYRDVPAAEQTASSQNAAAAGVSSDASSSADSGISDISSEGSKEVTQDTSPENMAEVKDPVSDPVPGELDLLLDPSLTVGGLKAMDYSKLKTQASFLINHFLKNDIPKNPYKVSAFHHDGDLLGYEDPEYEYQLGIDVSVFQGEIDWKKVKEQGISFAIIRAGYRGYGESGSLNEDELFRKNIAGAKEAGLLVGAYFFSQAVSREEAEEEAEYVLSMLDGIELDLPLVFDEEIIKNDDARTDAVLLSQYTENALAFFEKIKAAGYEPMLYTNLISECLVYDLEQLEGIPVWFAGYDSFPLTPYEFEYWQYTESGKLEGIEAPVDLNIRIRKVTS